MKCNECTYGEAFYIEFASLCGQKDGKLYERSVPARSGYICSNEENVHYLHLVHKDHECEEQEKMKKGPPSKALEIGKGSRRGDHWRKTREKIAKNNKSQKA